MEWFEFCLDEGLSIPELKYQHASYSGKFTVKVGKTILGKLTETVVNEEISLNSLINTYIHAG